MQRYYWLLGLCISLGVSSIAAFPRLLRAEVIEWSSFFHSVLYTGFFSLLCWYGHFFLMDSKKLNKAVPNKFWYGVLSIVALGLLAYVYTVFFSEAVSDMLPFRDIPPRKKLIAVMVRGFIISGFYYFITYSLRALEEKQKHKIEIEQLKQAQLKANLSLLKEQISPHFLFNTLNTLSTLTQEAVVKDFVNELANAYRYVLTYKDENTADVKQELDFISSYLYIIKTRLEDSIDITINVEKETLSTRIPPLTLQILIENAIKHNVASRQRPLKIDIYNSAQDLIIRNNFQPRQSVSHTTGTGLDNIAQRYRLLFDKEIVIEKDSNAFVVKLPIITA